MYSFLTFALCVVPNKLVPFDKYVRTDMLSTDNIPNYTTKYITADRPLFTMSSTSKN